MSSTEKSNSPLNLSDAIVLAVWNKARPHGNSPMSMWRVDMCGRLIRFSEYGNLKSPHGWVVDQIRPQSSYSIHSLQNLQPLHWKNKEAKGDKTSWTCAI